MSFVRPELAARFRIWRESALWAGLALAGLWLIWTGYRGLEPIAFVAGLIFAATGIGLLPAALQRMRLRADLGEGVVVLDEARIGYFGPRGGGFVDLPAIVRVEIVTRPHVPPDSGHAWVLTTDDGGRLVVPLGAEGADRMIDALSPLPGIDFDAGTAAIAAGRPGRATVWRKAG